MKIYFELSFDPPHETSSAHEMWLVVIKRNGKSETLRMLLSVNHIYYSEISFSDVQDISFHYYYAFRTEQDILLPEENVQRSFRWKKGMAEEYYLKDDWADPSGSQNTLLKAPFTNAFFKENGEGSYKQAGNAEIKFSVYAPGLDNNKIVCLLGNRSALGDWNTKEPVMMKKYGSKWMTQFRMEENEGECEYKYGLYDIKEGQFLYYEEGKNRKFFFHKNGNKTGTIITDNFSRFAGHPWRGGGAAVPVFSLRSRESFGVGEFTDIRLLADWAEKTGLKVLQLLPVNDTTSTHTWKDSYPYAAISAFALHPIYINLKKIGSLPASHLLEKKYPRIKESLNLLPELDYEKVLDFKWQYLKALYKKEKKTLSEDKRFRIFFKQHQGWLKPYAFFCYLREKYSTADYAEFEEFKIYDEKKINDFLSSEEYEPDKFEIHYFVQYHLHLQLAESVQYAHRKGIAIKGDIPIGISRFGVDAWMNPGQFFLDMQAGAPPDGFATKGQNWGFPVYNWSSMESDHFSWWKKRLQHLALYFDAVRFDHILGFFRIWQIPVEELEGIMGYFYPSSPLTIAEIEEYGILFDESAFCNPVISQEILRDYFDTDASKVADIFLEKTDRKRFAFKKEFSTQRKIDDFFKRKETDHEEFYGYWKQCLLDLISNVLFLRADKEGRAFHPRFGLMNTSSFSYQPKDQQEKLLRLHNEYFYHRNDKLWQQEAMRKLPWLKVSTRMLICGEDLGLMPHSVPDTLRRLGLLGMEVQRMPKQFGIEFTNLQAVPYLSVVTTSTHDTSTLRSWWEEDRGKTQRFFNQVMHHYGTAPYFCEPWVVKEVLTQHFQSPAMLVIIPIQDFLALSGKVRRENPHDERINIPADPLHYWRYRMHLCLEDVIENDELNRDILEMIVSSGRKHN